MDTEAEGPRAQRVEAEITDLKRRVAALEAAQNDTTQTLRWVVAKLGRMSSVQDEHTLHLERIEEGIDNIEKQIGLTAKKLDTLTEQLPAMLAEAVRSAMRDGRDS